MKIAIAGKGGVGKTTISAGLTLWLAEQAESGRLTHARSASTTQLCVETALPPRLTAKDRRDLRLLNPSCQNPSNGKMVAIWNYFDADTGGDAQ